MKYYWKFTEDIILTKTGASNSMSYSLMQNQYENAVENVHFIMHGIISRRKHTFEVCVMEACAI